MPEYSSTTITPADAVKTPAMNGATPGNYTIAALRDFILASKGQANGLASLGADGKLAAAQIPASLENVLFYATKNLLPSEGAENKIYVVIDEDFRPYAWDATAEDYAAMTPDLSAYATKAELQDEADARAAADSNLNSAINQLDHRVQNLEQAKGDYIVSSYKDGSTTPSGKGKWCVVEGVEGVSRVANNLLHDVNSWYAVSASMSVADGVVTFTRTGDNYLGYQVVPVVNGHKYILAIEVMASEACNVTFSNIIDFGSASVPANTWTKLYFIQDASLTSSSALRANAGVSNGGTLKIKDKAVITDLSVYFAGDPSVNVSSLTIADIQRDYPHLLLPSDYGVRIVDSSYSGVRAWSPNLFDQEWEVGGFDGNGNPISSSNIRSKNYIPIQQATSIYILDPSYGSLGHNMVFYDHDKNIIKVVIGTTVNRVMAVGTEFPSNACFMKFAEPSQYGTTYKGDLQVSEVPSGTATSVNTTFHDYFESTLSLTFSGKSAGSVSEMYYPETGEKTKPLRTVVYNGTENWLKSGVSGAFYLTLDNTTFPYKWASDVQALSIYPFLGTGAQSVDVLGDKDDAMGLFFPAHDPSVTTREIWIKDTSFATTDAWKAHLAENPLTVYYELATPDPSTFVTSIIDNTLLTEAGGRMATVQTGTVVDGSFDMGFITL